MNKYGIVVYKIIVLLNYPLTALRCHTPVAKTWRNVNRKKGDVRHGNFKYRQSFVVSGDRQARNLCKCD